MQVAVLMANSILLCFRLYLNRKDEIMRAERKDNSELVYGFISIFPKTKHPITITSEEYIDNSGIPIVKTYMVKPNTICEFVMKDKNGKDIYTTDKFKFNYTEELHKEIELIGCFTYNEDELRYEIDIFGNDRYVCLSYVSNGIMSGFELIPK